LKRPFLTAALSAIILLFQPSAANGMQPPSNQADTLACNCVAFRFDDIQDYFLDQVQMRVIGIFTEANASLTIGVIANHIGEDNMLVPFLKESIENGSSLRNHSGAIIEVANHGWNHEDFTAFNKELQSQLMRDGNKKIFDTLGVEPIVFIPPFNAINNDTIASASENKMYFVSANASNYPPSILPQYQSAGNATITDPTSRTVYHFPSIASTGDLNDDNTQWLGYSHNDTLRAIESGLQEYGYVVVTMHPQEYSLRNGLDYANIPDSGQLAELELLIKLIQNAGIRIVTISQIGEYAMVPEFIDNILLVVLVLPFISILVVSSLAKFKVHGSKL
jgi:peptidoglycan/xylan/chitin deacetylase (PgdA/CDA1 family)